MFDKLKEIYAYAKATMNKQRFYFNYYFLPALLIFGGLDLVCVLVMMLVDSKRLLWPSLIVFLILVVALIGGAIALPFIKKSEIKDEAKRLDEFFDSKLVASPEHEYVLPRANEGGIVPLTFTKTGLVIDGISYSYNGFDCALFTSNYRYHANLIVVFNRNEVGDQEDGDKEGVKSFSLPLDINMLSIIDEFDIKLVNADVLAFIKDNTYLAAKQILKYGKIQKRYDRYKTR